MATAELSMDAQRVEIQKKQIAALEKEVTELEARVEKLEADNSDLEQEVETLKGEVAGVERISDAVSDFLAECERPRPLQFVAPQSDRVSRAILAMHDAIGGPQ